MIRCSLLMIVELTGFCIHFCCAYFDLVLMVCMYACCAHFDLMLMAEHVTISGWASNS